MLDDKIVFKAHPLFAEIEKKAVTEVPLVPNINKH